MTMQIRRTPTANNPPSNLDEGQLAVEMATAVRPNLWVGVPATIDPAGRRLVNARQLIVTVSDTDPATPIAGDLWWDSISGAMFVWYVDAGGGQWVETTSSDVAGPQGPPGAPGAAGGAFPDVVTPGAYLRTNGAWIPVTTATTFLAADVAINAINTWVTAVTLNVGTVGIWFFSGTIGIWSGENWAGARVISGATVLASSSTSGAVTGNYVSMSLSGIVTNPNTTLTLQGMLEFGTPSAIISNNAYTLNQRRETMLSAFRIG